MDNALRTAARVFNFKIPAWLPDTTEVGTIAGVVIHAGDIRRLNKALEIESSFGPALPSNLRGLTTHQMKVVMGLLFQHEFINAIKEVRSATYLGLKEAKDITEQIGEDLGLRKDSSGYGNGRTWVWML